MKLSIGKKGADRARLVIEFAPEEAQLLALLAHQLAQLIEESDEAPRDDVVVRLFPEAYRDDPDAAAEFRRYTRSGLRDYKLDGSTIVASAVTLDTRVSLDHSDAERWARTLTDIRIMVGTRIGIEDDDPPPTGTMGDVYNWLSELQAVIIDALSSGRVTA